MVFLLALALLRFVLLVDNHELWNAGDAGLLLESFLIGMRFDGRMIAWALLPIVLLPLLPMKIFENFCLAWLTWFFCAFTFLGLLEIEFYSEFQQRLNSLVIQYMSEDPGTVSSMIWHGYPVVTYIGTWLLATVLGFLLLRRAMSMAPYHRLHPVAAVSVALVLLVADVSLARGTWRSGPPLRWGDAYHSDNMFLNHLGLNGGFTLAHAVISSDKAAPAEAWLETGVQADPLAVTRDMLLLPDEKLLTPGVTAVRRSSPGDQGIPPGRNVVIILMESFSGQFVGTLGHDRGATPRFDELAEEGVLFTRALSNGTHTHQGIFATLSCFPNLPGYEYLMQTEKGMQRFSGLTALLPDYQSVFVYNGDFSWDNQQGYFRNQGMRRFVGRDDYVLPRFVDPVWGVSDEDMFDRGLRELDELAASGPFVGILQTLSNHVPYSIPKHNDFEPVRDAGGMSERLTAMKYSDWALGRFFDEAKKRDWYDNTLFVVLGDHGFSTDHQLTEVNLLRFHVPVLFLGPGIAPGRSDTVISQVDIVPTLAGLTGRDTTHQCWGRNVFSLPENDKGFAVIKPSGNDMTTAIVSGSNVLTWEPERGSHLYQLDLAVPDAVSQFDPALTLTLENQLRSYIATALSSLDRGTTYASLD